MEPTSVHYWLHTLKAAHQRYNENPETYDEYSKQNIPVQVPLEVISLEGDLGHRLRACVARDIAECEIKAPMQLRTTWRPSDFADCVDAYHAINGSPRGWFI